MLEKIKTYIVKTLAERKGCVHEMDIINVFGGIPKSYPAGEELARYSKGEEGRKYINLESYIGLFKRVVESTQKKEKRLYFSSSDFARNKTDTWEEIMFYVRNIKELRDSPQQEGMKPLTANFYEINTTGFC